MEKFQDYVSDFKAFTEQVVLPEQKRTGKKLFLLSHSMGGMIVSRYLQSNESPYDAQVLSAPLFEMYTRPATEAEVFANAVRAIAAGNGGQYYQGRGNYNPEAPFAPNPLTTSPARFEKQAKLAKEYAETVVGGQSNQWMKAFIEEAGSLLGAQTRITVPTLLLQAGNDRIAEAQRQNEFCREAPECRVLAFAESKHHFFLEADSIRESVLRKIEALFQ